MRLSRTVLLQLVLVAFTVWVTAGPVLAAPITIKAWDFFTGGDGVRWKQLVDQFNRSQQEVRVESTTFPWGPPFYTRLRTAALAGEQPDVATFHISLMPAWVPSGLLRPFSRQELASVGLSTSDFLPRLVEGATYNNQLYGVPLDTHPFVLYYNKNILASAGLLGSDGKPTGITGAEAFTNALRQIKQRTNKTPVAMETCPGCYAQWRLWYALIAQQGAELFHGESLYVGEEAKRALQLLADWAKEGLLTRNATYPAHVALFAQGQAAFMINGVWEVPTLEDLKAKGELPFDYGIVPLPRLFNISATWADSHVLVIPASQRNPITQEKLTAVLKFIAYVEKNALIWAGGGHLPAYRPVLQSDEFRNLKPNSDYIAAADQVVYDPRVWIAGAAGPLENTSLNFLSPAINGQVGVDEALQGFAREVERLMAVPR